jgi:hypothetical protein
MATLFCWQGPSSGRVRTRVQVANQSTTFLRDVERGLKLARSSMLGTGRSASVCADRSIIRQSYDARERLLDPTLPAHLGHGNLNADGFGIGWYTRASPCEPSVAQNTPCTFKSITPAWNNDNLMRLATKIFSPLVFAHVRAAYPGMPVSEQNVRSAAVKFAEAAS